MNHLILVAIFGLVQQIASSQDTPEDCVYGFFQAMYDVDTTHLRDLFAPHATLGSTLTQDSLGKVIWTDVDRFITSVGRSSLGELDERIYNLKTSMDKGLANVWMDYSFYYQGALHHCGVNNISLAKIDTEWKIIHISDTRHNDECSYHNLTNTLDKLLDDWHLAAAQADSTNYFNKMTTNATYIGTDATEVWSKRAFLSFAAPYFAKGKAWDFKKIERNIYISEGDKIAWFDELLNTWMGPCRGSGVLRSTYNGWKIQHYVLSVTVDNEDIQKFLQINVK